MKEAAQNDRYYTRPPQARRDAPLPEEGRRERARRGILDEYVEESTRLKTTLRVFLSSVRMLKKVIQRGRRRKKTGGVASGLR
jgi:hypothetical protein